MFWKAMLQTHCMMFGLKRTASGRTTRAMMMLTFSGTLLGVVAASVVSVWLGDALHRRVNSAAVALATLLFLSVASVQMFSIDLRIRLTLTSTLALVAARVHRETLAVYLSQRLLTALAPTVSITKLDGVAGRRWHDTDEVNSTTSTSSRCAAGNLRQRQPQQRRRLHRSASSTRTSRLTRCASP